MTAHSWGSHLLELRKRLLRCIYLLSILAIPLIYFSKELYYFLARPALSIIPNGQFIATGVVTPFTVPLKLAIFLAFLLAAPYILYQVWGFIAPGLYPHEKRPLVPALFFSILLFFLGLSFAYFVVCPIAFNFFAKMAPQGVVVMTDISQYFNFIITMMLCFGGAFQIPIVTLLLIKANIVTRQELAQKRPYIIVGAFCLGMFFTPPDIISQVLLAIPLWLLFESGLIISRFTDAQQAHKKTAPS